MGKRMMNDHDKAVGEYIRRRREELRLTQKEVSERLKARGVDRADSTIANWEHGRQHIPAETLAVIAEVLEEKSPMRLYVLAGLFQRPSISNLVLLLDSLSEEKLRRIEKGIDAMFGEHD